MAQMTETFLPCIFEHGAGLFFPRAFRYQFDPLLGPNYSARLASLRAALEPDLLQPGRAFVQPGKEATMTLYPLGDTTLDEILAIAQRVRRPMVSASNATSRASRSVPLGIDKGLGLRRIAELLDLPEPQIAGVGDSDPDLSFLRLVGISAAPANASANVRAGVHQMASMPYGQGLLEILESLENSNRASV